MKKKFYVGSAGLLVAMLLGSCASGGGDSKASQDPLDAVSSDSSDGVSPIVDKPEYVTDEGVSFCEYGYYPQTHVSDKETIAALDAMTSPQMGSWYFYKGDYYAKTTLTFVVYSYFDDGEKIKRGSTYWFKCEPIRWKVLSSAGKQTKLVSAKLLDTQNYTEYYFPWCEDEEEECISKFGYYLNNYKESLVRDWLNGEFYNAAFSFGDSFVLTTEVDNSAATTNDPKTKYACENTNDKVYLLSYQDYSTYFSDDSSRMCLTTDWARAKGAATGNTPDIKKMCEYWTRSPYAIDKFPDFRDVCVVSILGSKNFFRSQGYSETDPPYICVRPAITISD